MARKKPLSGLIRGPGPNNEIIGGFDGAGLKTVKPITFLGGTVLSFNSSLGLGPLEESSLSVELINDCFADPDNVFYQNLNPPGSYFLGEINIGSPVFFDLGEATAPERTRELFESRRDEEIQQSGIPSYFRFGGILQSYTAKQSSSGLTFDARVVDPRSLLGGVNIVVANTLSGPIKHRNYYNAYAYYEYGVLKPEKREVQPENGYTIPGTVEEDKPVDLEAAHTGLEPPLNLDIVDCRVYGSSSSDERGMRYIKVIQALKEMNPLVYSPNYAEEFYPTLDGRELDVALVNNQLRHQRNIFKIDLSTLPEDEVPAYYRIPGPNITLLDLISNVCEATGRIFHVTLEQASNPNELHTIKIVTESIRDLKARATTSVQSEIRQYNGASSDLTYGKELTTENTRTLLIGEQKHEMYESINIEPFFGEDKFGNPIVPVSGSQKGCGWDIEIYLNELNDTLRCPLYDYSVEDGDGKELEVLTRKVRVSEYHLRIAASGFEIWKKWAFNPLNSDDLATVCRRNFPDFSVAFLNSLYGSMMGVQEYLSEQANRPRDFLPESGPRSLTDLLNQWNADMLVALQKKQSESMEQVFNWISQFARSNYGVNFVAIVSKDLCVAPADYMDLSYINSAGIKVDKDYTVYDDPCASGDSKIVTKMWQPRIYTHIPTNDGAWIENCGSVLGLGGPEEESEDESGTNILLNFFRSEDNRITPMARFDSKVLAKIFRTEGLVDDGVSRYIGEGNVIEKRVGSSVQGAYSFNKIPDNADISELLFTSGICGDLEIKSWSPDKYIQVRETGMCPPPPTGADQQDPIDAIDLPTTVWAKCTVGDKIYIDESGCITYNETIIEPVQRIGDPCCGKYQIWNPQAECYWFGPLESMPDEDCVVRNIITTTKSVCSGVVRIPFSMDDGCFSRYCDDQNQLEMLAQEMETLMSGIFQTGLAITDDAQPATYDPNRGKIVIKDGSLIQRTSPVCYETKPTGIQVIASVLDFNSNNNHKIQATAFIPTAVAIPVKSNIETYGPWKSSNFETSSGGVELVHDTDLCPWVFNSKAEMNTFAEELVNDRSYNKTEIETGSITVPMFPDRPLGFVKNGPNLTNINVSMGSGGVTTTYNFRSYTPKFGGMKTLEKNALKQNMGLINKIRKMAQDKTRKVDAINRKLKGGGVFKDSTLNPKLTDTGTLHRVLVGETYPFTQLYKEVQNSGDTEFTITGSGDRTVVGTETLQKSVVELRYDYRKKAFMSLDGIFSPVRNSGTDPSGTLPMYAAYSGFPNTSGAKSIYNAPNPPVKVSGIVINDIAIDRSYLDPLQNPFASGDHHYPGSGAGHNIDMVGRGSGAPDSGVIMNFYGKKDWKDRYSDEYRFLGLRGPLVLHQWGYDTQGKPIPNAIDDHDLIKNSGVFRTEISGVGPNAATTGLQDYFMEDWLQKPSAWPVAPVDLRFDRQRGLWVSPPEHKIVVIETETAVNAYSSGSAFLINERETSQYNQPIYDADGVLIKGNDDEADDNKRPKVTIEDRIGRNISQGEKSYAYFDSFSSTYLLMGGGGGGNIKIGKFCNQWPSLSNVKDPANCVKEVVLYKKSTTCLEGTDCPWSLEPEMVKISGVDNPLVVKAVNLFSNVPAHEYQTKWCALLQNDGNYYLLAAEG